MKLPKPPNDIWAQLEKVRGECELKAPPDNAINSAKYGAAFGLGEYAARRELKRLADLGKLTVWGKYKGTTYYELV